MLRLAIVCACAIAGCVPAHAQAGDDLMKTPQCIAARQQLDAVLAAGGPRDLLTVVRRQAALRCLGLAIPADSVGPATLKPDRATPSAARNHRVPPPPVAVEPIRLRPTPALPQAPARPGPVGPPPAATAPVAITACDATGCWDSTGARHNQQGPVLLGPRGACTQQGGLLNCP